MKEIEYLKEKNELVDIVHCAFNDWDDYNEECYESHISPIEDVEDFVADAVLHAGYQKQEWISVGDALPEEDVRVLVWLAEKNPSKYTRIDTDRMLGGKWVRWECYVTHWMPLPDAPKGE